MGVVSSDLTSALLAGMQTIFMSSLADTETVYQDISTLIRSTKQIESYTWLGQTSMPRAFDGERVPRGLVEQGFSVTNVTYTNTIEIDRESLEDEQYGQLGVRVQDLAVRANQFIDKTAAEKLASGNTDLCYDGQAFFDTDHADVGAEYTTAQSNKLTLAFSEANLRTAITTHRKFMDDRGVPVAANPTHILTGPDLEWDVGVVLKSVQRPGGAWNDTNLLQGRLTQLVCPWITDANWWCLLDCRGAVRPLLYQLRVPPVLSSYTPQGTQETYESFMRERYLWGTRTRFAVAYGDWRRALASDPDW